MSRSGRSRLLTLVRAGLVLSVLVLMGLGSMGQAAVIELKPTAKVTGNVVTLGDVARVQDIDEAIVSRLNRVLLMPAPPAGRQARIDFEQIRTRLEAQGESLAQIDFSGSSQVLITSLAEPAPAAAEVPVKKAEPPVSRTPAAPVLSDQAIARLEDRVAKAISQSLAVQVPSLGRCTVQVELTEAQRTELALAGQTVRLIASGGQRPWVGKQPYSVQWTDGQKQSHRIDVVCGVQQWPVAVVARRSVARGEILRPDDLMLGQIAPDQTGRGHYRRVQDVAGQEAKQVVKEGEPILAEQVRAVAVVRRGDLVSVLSRQPGITVRIDAKAQEDGSIGETVQLVTMDGKQRLIGRVTGYHELEVTSNNATKERRANDSSPVEIEPTPSQGAIPQVSGVRVVER